MKIRELSLKTSKRTSKLLGIHYSTKDRVSFSVRRVCIIGMCSVWSPRFDVEGLRMPTCENNYIRTYGSRASSRRSNQTQHERGGAAGGSLIALALIGKENIIVVLTAGCSLSAKTSTRFDHLSAD